MKRLLIVTAALLLLAPTSQAQGLTDPAMAFQAPGPCGASTVWALRGTYAFSATGWQDLSEINPMLPKGYAPLSIIGAFQVNGNGDLTGWALINVGGVQLTAEFVNSQFGAPKAGCQVPITLSMKIKEFEGVVGPYAYAGVIAGDASALEIVFMMLGTGPGSHVDSNRAKRISMNFD
jgi:hypothetical protein